MKTLITTASGKEGGKNHKTEVTMRGRHESMAWSSTETDTIFVYAALDEDEDISL